MWPPPSIISLLLALAATSLPATAVQPVNRYFSAANSQPQPDLECLVGIDSKDVSELYKVKCTEAWNISIKYERATANGWAAAKYISEHDRRLRTLKFGIQGSGVKYNAHTLWANWTDVTNWVCSYIPITSVLIYDCIPENQAPPWWKDPLMGPAFPSGHKPAPKEMRHPGCNGGVCYCNTDNYCNDRHNAVSNNEECPVEQPHHRWDQRCLGQQSQLLQVSSSPEFLSVSAGSNGSEVGGRLVLAGGVSLLIAGINILLSF